MAGTKRPSRAATVFLCGDVMTGRGVDQILPHPGDPRLWEPYARDARAYVELAEAATGPIPRPSEVTWPWGDALPVLDAVAPDVRVINLETSVTRSDAAAVPKPVLYRMSPANIGCLSVARPDACALANNHVLDFGHSGLAETRHALAAAGIAATGAGRDADEAARPVTVPVGGDRRVIVFSVGTTSSGIPASWAAAAGRPGVDLLPDLSGATADRMAARVRRVKRPGDIAVVSIHWGSNWGYEVPREHVDFAHLLLDGGVDILHGHSSHHPRPVEVYRDKLVLYGCGDLINDYEGIGGREEYRDDLRLLYFASVHPGAGWLVRLRMVPMRARRLRLHRASPADANFLREALDRVSRPFGSHVDLAADGELRLRTVAR